MCAATLAIKFDSLEVVKNISKREQSALSAAAVKYAEMKKADSGKK
ncbi:MAG TPA: hypothetical protein PLE43_09360 [Alphaproteobacteria bacterium]|jgi:hypothetical protein|nr:hypothetical protein [Alphaproteobacteria bacterium]